MSASQLAGHTGSANLMQSILPSVVVAVETFGDDPAAEPFPGEEGLVVSAVESRKQELITTRRCARDALGQLGYPPTSVGRGPQREPLWPEGVVGAMTHCDGYRAAAVAPRAALAGIGIDAEPHAPLPEGVLAHVASACERRDLDLLASAHPHIRWDRLIFSAKEALYKVWYPLMREWLGFEDAHVHFDPQTQTFRADLMTSGTPSSGELSLDTVRGRFAVTPSLVVTAATVAVRGSRSMDA